MRGRTPLLAAIVVLLLATGRVVFAPDRPPSSVEEPAPGTAPNASAAPPEAVAQQDALPKPEPSPLPGPGLPGGPPAPPAGEPTPPVPLPAVAADDAGLAAQLLEARAVLRDSTAAPERQAAAGHTEQLAAAALATDPARIDRVLASVDDLDLHYDLRANVAAAQEFLDMQGTPPSRLPRWRIVAPPPPEALRGFYAEAEAASGVPWAYLAAIHLVETRMSRIAGDSAAGAQGPMQFIPATWARFGGGGDVRDTRTAVLAAGRYLASEGAPADLDSALFAYNNDRRYVRAVRAYAERMLADERAFLGYYHWQVHYAQPGGPLWLAEGYDGTAT